MCGCAEDGRAVGAGRLFDLLGQRRGVIDPGGVYTRHHRLEHEVVKRRLVGDMVVRGHGIDPELGAQPAHGERLEPLGVDDLDGRVDDALPSERFDVFLAWSHLSPLRFVMLRCSVRYYTV